MAGYGVPGRLLRDFRGVLMKPQAPAHQPNPNPNADLNLKPQAPAHQGVLSLLVILAQQGFTAEEAALLWDILLAPQCPVTVLASLVPMVRGNFGASYWELSMENQGYGCVELSGRKAGSYAGELLHVYSNLVSMFACSFQSPELMINM